MTDPVNQTVADKLRQAADLLEQQGANPFRVRAYRNAAATIGGLDQDLRGLFELEGLDGLTALPGIGASIRGREGECSQYYRRHDATL